MIKIKRDLLDAENMFKDGLISERELVMLRARILAEEKKLPPAQ